MKENDRELVAGMAGNIAGPLLAGKIESGVSAEKLMDIASVSVSLAVLTLNEVDDFIEGRR